MMSSDQHDDTARENARENPSQQSFAALRALREHGVDVTGSESGTELAAMQSAVEAFRRAAELLAGRVPLGDHSSDLCRHVVPPRAADETPRQYAERVNRMTERFRALSQGPTRERGR